MLRALLHAKRSGLSDNTEPDQLSLARARATGRAVIDAVNNRDAAIAAKGLDPRFALPDSNWRDDSANDYIAAYKMLRSLEWSEIKYLRLRTQIYSGYSLLYMTHASGGRNTDPVPSNFDERIPRFPPPQLLVQWLGTTMGLPEKYVYKPKPMLGEVGWWVDGVLLNYDTVRYQERVTLLYHGGMMKKLQRRNRVRILEIGGGYGALASAILSIFPSCEYWICDLPESLLFSALNLSLTQPASVNVYDEAGGDDPGVVLLPNYRFPEIVAGAGRSFDLVINTLSFAEMSEHQITQYASGIARLIGRSGVLFEQNQDNSSVGMVDCKQIIARHLHGRSTIAGVAFRPTTGVADVWWNV